MHLKRLTVHGFKSFADKTHFDFESELTGIVGPNGCGKSNVVDALKWVLGDQRVRSLRGKEMTDVIFKGAEGRDGSHQALVTVEMVDDSGVFGERTEVTIGRRLNKEKESDYLLNGERVRLKDVRDVLMDTGLGVGAYSVMEQGRIDAVLSANPEDRRAIFEEAAGISRFKLQKRETLRKLDRTEINLQRVKDLLEERGRRIRSLKIQAGKARRYHELRHELRDLRTAVAVVTARELRERHAEQAARLAELNTDLAAGEERGAALERQRDELDQTIERRSHDYETHQDQIRAVQSRVDAGLQRAETHDHRAEDQRANAADSRRRQAELGRQREEKERALASVRQRVSQLEAELLRLAEELDAGTAAVREAQDQLRDLQNRREQARREVLEWMNDRTRARNAAHDMRAGLKAQDARRSGLAARQAELDRELTALEAEVGALDESLEAGAREVARLVAEESMAIGELELADEEAAELARAESQLRQEISSVAGRLQVLADMESHMEGLDQGPRYLLERSPVGLQGRLLDLLDTDVEFSAALEAALGPYVQALIVETREQADGMHEMLRREGKGRAILLVEREIPDDLLEARSLYDIPDGATKLSNHVEFPGYARCLVHWLLRGVCLVDSLDQAVAERHDICFVTRDGSLLCGPRIEGGSAEGQGGLLVRKATIQALTTESTELDARLAKLLADRREVEERVAGLKAEARGITGLVQDARGRILAMETERKNLLSRCVAGERDLAELTLQIDELDRHRATLRASLTTLLMNAFCMGRQEARAAQREVDIAALFATTQTEAEAVGRAEQELQLQRVASQSDREAARDACRLHEQALRELQQETEALVGREEESLRAAGEHVQKASACRAEVETVRGELQGIAAQRDTAARALAVAREAFGKCKDQLAEQSGERSGFRDQITEERLALGEIEHRFEWLETRLYEDVNISLRRCLGEVRGMGHVVERLPGPLLTGACGVHVEQLQGPPLPESMLADELLLRRLWEDADFDAEATAKEVKVLQARIERLGSVNLEAVHELQEEEADLVLTEQEVKDLTEARASLAEALRRMEEESRELFEETFRLARENFHILFRKLFQGGRADMYLTEGEDALEGGIEIVARPPGKELQSINLLSGGERTLTALAILFAVFKVKPSPFCILDEVDAALDDTNVERFLRVLRDFVGPTQFCIVTHHKRTMAACNTLYGVTMQKRGVSSRIAVNLEQVDELTETGLRSNGQSGGRAKPHVAGEEALGFS